MKIGMKTGMKTGALVLAAGFSRRFGSIKLDAALANGSTVLQQTLQQLAAATPRIRVVTRQALLDAGLFNRKLNINGRPVPIHEHVQLLLCEDAESGMGHSLAYGARHIDDWDACLVCLADMPFIRPETYQQLFAALDQTHIVLPRYQGKSGNPVGFARQHYKALSQCDGDTGARKVISNLQQQVLHLDVDDAAIHRDIDTPEDLRGAITDTR